MRNKNSGKRRKKEKEELPDYTVADMNIEGMPWHIGGPSGSPGGTGNGGLRTGRGAFGTGGSWTGGGAFGSDGFDGNGRESDGRTGNGESRENYRKQEPRFTKEESRQLTWIAVKAALLIGLVFVGAALLFVLFCLHVWF